MKNKIYLVCTHSRDHLKFGKIYIVKKEFTSSFQTPLYIVSDLNNIEIEIAGFYRSRFKKCLDLEEAKFISIKLKLGAIKVKDLDDKYTCKSQGLSCSCI